MSIGMIASLAGNVAAIIGFAASIVGVFRKLHNISNGQQCQLRSDITAIYYRHVDEDEPTMREYERKNLDDLFAAYKALNGNHFVDDIYSVMRGWKVSN